MPGGRGNGPDVPRGGAQTSEPVAADLPWRRAPDTALDLVERPSAAAPPVGARAARDAQRDLAPLEPAVEAESERRYTLAARILVTLVAVLLVHGAWRVGPTYDEHFYAAAGRAYLDQPDFGLNREHPPLLKYMAGVPLLLLGVEPDPNWRDQVAYPASFFYTRNGEDLSRNLFAVRLPFCALAAWTVWALFRLGRAWFGARAGFVGAFLLGLNPNWLAHGRLAGLDAGTAALVFLALIAFVHALERPTARRTLAAACLFGLANLAKFTGLLLGPACIALGALAAVLSRSTRPLLVLARVLLAGLGVFAAGYAFEARPINALWGEPAYPLSVSRAELDRGALVGLLEQELAALAPRPALADQLVRDVAGASDGARALEVLLGAVVDPTPPGLAIAALGATRALDGGPGDLRRRVVDVLLGLEGSHPVADLRLERVAALAEREIAPGPDGDPAEHLARWRAWHDRAASEDWNERILTDGPFDRLTRGLLGDRIPIPLISAIKGIDYQLYHGRYGHGSYFKGVPLQAGRDFADGNPFPEYYATVMGVKNPLAFLAATVLGIVFALLSPTRFGALRLAACLLFPAACFGLFSTGNTLMGVRYVLPIFPFLALFGARLAASLPRTALVLCAVAAAESLWIHPHELMYYNAAGGGPRGGPALTVVGDDWGQDVRATGAFLARHRAPIEAAGGLWYEPYSVGDPAAFGLVQTRLPDGPVRGIVAVHAVHLMRERAKFQWLDGFAPFTHLGYSVYIYDTRAGPPGNDPGWR